MRIWPIVLAVTLAACNAQPPSGPTAPPLLPPSTPSPLTPVTSPLPFEGAYELSFSIASECADDFPVQLRVRRYRVTVLKSADHSELDFEDQDVADSISEGPGYSSTGVARGFEAGLSLLFGDLVSYSEAGYPQILRVDALAWDGDSFLPIRHGAIEGHARGRVYYDAGAESAECTSDDHNFYLKPR